MREAWLSRGADDDGRSCGGGCWWTCDGTKSGDEWASLERLATVTSVLSCCCCCCSTVLAPSALKLERTILKF